MLLRLCFGPAHLLLLCFLTETASNFLFLCSIFAVVWWGPSFHLLWKWKWSFWIPIPCSIFILGLSLGWQVFGLLLIYSHWILRSRFFLFYSGTRGLYGLAAPCTGLCLNFTNQSGTRGCICWVFSLAFSLLCSLFYFSILDCVYWSLPAVS